MEPTTIQHKIQHEKNANKKLNGVCVCVYAWREFGMKLVFVAKSRQTKVCSTFFWAKEKSKQNSFAEKSKQ